MFLGRYEHTLNKQGRTSIPAKFREICKESGEDCLILTNDDGFLVAYPLGEWKAFEEKLSQLSQTSREVREFLRFFVSGAQECPIDSQGRILVPPTLREHAGLEKEIVLVGMLKRIEIWSKERWVKEFEHSRARFNENSQALANLGL